jgi:flagellar basal body rod protein FlgG
MLRLPVSRMVCGCLLVAAGAAGLAGCRSSDGLYSRSDVRDLPRQHRAFVEALADLDTNAVLKRAAQARQGRQQLIDELAKRAFTAPGVQERTLAILAASKLGTDGLDDTLLAIQGAMEVVTANVANMGTIGYKRKEVFFTDNGRKFYLAPDMSQGAEHPTGRPLHAMILGTGFFQLQKPDGGTAYTRNGSFDRDSAGNIVNANGWKLLPGLSVPPKATGAAIRADGSVWAVFAKGPDGQIGQIQLATFNSPEKLRCGSEATIIYEATDASGPPVVGSPGLEQLGVLMPGCLELSNVDATLEMITLLQLSRWFEGVVGAIDTIYGQANKRSAK